MNLPENTNEVFGEKIQSFTEGVVTMDESIFEPKQMCPICKGKAKVKGTQPLDMLLRVSCQVCYTESDYIIGSKAANDTPEQLKQLPNLFRQLKLEKMEVPMAYWDEELNQLAVKPYK